MAILGIVSQTAWKVANKVGLYSKKQSVELATSIGKELVDISRGGGEITKDIVQATLKKHIPRAKVSIITDKKEFANLLRSSGENPEALDFATGSYAAMYFNLLGNAKGIYIPQLSSTRNISEFAHEFEHYMYNEHTPKRKFLVSIAQKIAKLEEKFKPSKDPGYNQIELENNVQGSLINGFNIQDIANTGGLRGVKADTNSVSKLLSGQNYRGLTSDKRVDAYVRGIIRHHLHPRNKEVSAKMLLTKTTLDDEIRAYSVSDSIERYANNSDDITRDGFIAEIYKKASNALKQDMRLSFNPCYSKKPTTVGLPTNAYCGKRVMDMLMGSITNSFSKVEGKPISIKTLGIYEKLNAKHKTIKISAEDLKNSHGIS